ncbi:MAG: hypothetical protein R3E95_00390 [Thiolinea sp.]
MQLAQQCRVSALTSSLSSSCCMISSVKPLASIWRRMSGAGMSMLVCSSIAGICGKNLPGKSAKSTGTPFGLFTI